MALDGTAWTAEVCETDSVLEKPVVHSPSALLSGHCRVRAAVLFGLVVGVMLYVKMLYTFTCLPLSHKHSVFEHMWKNVEFCSSKGVAAGFRYNGFHPRCAVDWQLLPAAVRRPPSHVAGLRPVADQGVALDDDHVLIVPSMPKHCGAQPGWAARQGMFLLTLTS